MTVVIGLKCSEGVVLGSDGAATLGTMGLRTIVQPTAKLSLIENKAIFGFSGQVGLSQLYYDRACATCATIQDVGLPEVCRRLRDGFLQDANISFQAAALARQVVGSVASENIASQTLIALGVQGQPELIQFDYQCHPEWTTNELPFVSIGSGETIADPFLAWIRYVFWRRRLPTLAEGRFAVYWTLTHAIRTAPGGIGPPIQMATLERKRDEVTARELSEAELEEHKVAISEYENLIRELFGLQKRGPAPPPPPAPPIPPPKPL
jgi:hypothetical protein